MLVHPETLQITAVLDFEFTNAMPAQFTYDPPWWLLLSGPEVWLDRGSIEEFRTLYTPRMEQFLRALEQVESASLSTGTEPTGPPLSSRMRDSWRDGGFWFNYAARKSFELDAIYWAVLHHGSAEFSLQEDVAEIDKFTQTKMAQLKAYKEECDARLPKQAVENTCCLFASNVCAKTKEGRVFLVWACG
ncbi:hypothetical protein J3458_015461 [Metarhizium acridum]|uniref:uncharacterized protein n=1 Tax=Metarhizium acridum TaxID=92637 RepID=UPI001C6C5957|nr:hypothetical protein J3458_015461 [Metarhizium acridum]